MKRMFLSTAIIILVGLFPFLSWGSEYWFEFSCAFFSSIFNSFIGYYLVISSIHESNSKFYTMVYGGMLVRMSFLLGFALYMILNSYVDAVPFFLSLMIFYLIHQWIEIYGWLQEIPLRKVRVSS